MGALLVTCGFVLTGVGSWSGYRNARDAVSPASGDLDPTRSAIDAARPLLARRTVRRFARSLAVAVAWLALALYGIFLVSAGTILAGHA
jgi:hypothetical protein